MKAIMVYHFNKRVLYFCIGVLPMFVGATQQNLATVQDKSSLYTVSNVAFVAQQFVSIALLTTAAVSAYYAIQHYRNDGRKSSYNTASVIPLSDSFKSLGGKPPKAVQQLVEYVKNPQIRERYRKLKVNPYKGVLLYGPPGTGKTVLARAIAAETQVPFFHQKPGDILDRWIGASERNIAQVFSQAREAARKSAAGMAIIFFDEFESIAGIRKIDVYHACVPQLLAELDGFEKDSGVLVIAATNKKESLDEAVIREGRFDVKIRIGFPTVEKQQKILKACLCNTRYEHRDDNEKMDATIKDLLAKLVQPINITPALLAELVKEAARRTAHRGNVDSVTDKILTEVFDEYVSKVPRPSDPLQYS